MNQKSLIRSISVVVIGLIGIVMFQNCGMGAKTATFQTSTSGSPVVGNVAVSTNQPSPVGNSSSTPTTSTLPTGASLGGGQGYDGMIYVHKVAGSVCSDGTDIDMVIMFKPEPYLTRENCASIPELNQVQVVVHESTKTLGAIVYKGQELTPSGLFDWNLESGISTNGGQICLPSTDILSSPPIDGADCDPYALPGSITSNSPLSRTAYDMTRVTNVTISGSQTCGTGGSVRRWVCKPR